MFSEDNDYFDASPCVIFGRLQFRTENSMGAFRRCQLSDYRTQELAFVMYVMSRVLAYECFHHFGSHFSRIS